MKSQQWSYAKLAKETNHNPATIYRLAVSQRHPSFEMVEDIAIAMNLSKTNQVRLFSSAGYLTSWQQKLLTDPTIQIVMDFLLDPSNNAVTLSKFRKLVFQATQSCKEGLSSEGAKSEGPNTVEGEEDPLL